MNTIAMRNHPIRRGWATADADVDFEGTTVLTMRSVRS